MDGYDGNATHVCKDPTGKCESRDILSIAQIYYERDISANCQSNSSPTSSERKRKLSNLLDNFMLKRQKHHMNSSDLGAQLNSRKLAINGFDLHKEERSGSSGKRSRDSYCSEARLEGEAFNDDSAAKRRKLGHASNDIQLKMLGPLKLPDYVKNVEYDSKIDPEIIKLNNQLIYINKELRAGGTVDNCPDDEQSPSNNEIGIRVNTRANRIRAKLGRRRQQIICELNQKNPLFRPPSDVKPSKFSRKLYIPVKQYPDYNFIGLIIGPRGHTQKRMERESGARILLRGKGSTRLRKTKQYNDSKTNQVEDEDLHVYIEADDENSLETASEMVEKLLVPMNEEVKEHKHAQLKELAELNMEISSEALNATSPLNPKPSEPIPETENSSHKFDHLSSPHIDATKPALTSSDTKLYSASEALTSLDTKTGEVLDKAKLFVGFLPPSVNTEKLIELFLPFGRLCEAVVITNRRTGLSKGYGFVKYIDHLSAAKALVHMNGFKIDENMINVRFAGWAPSKVNTIIGPRALKFANLQKQLASGAMYPYTFSQRFVTKGWNYWAMLPKSQAYVPKCNAFPVYGDSMYRIRPHVFAQFSERMAVPYYPHQRFATKSPDLKHPPVVQSLERGYTYI